MKEVWNLWRTSLHKIVERRARKYHKLPGFHQHQYSLFWQKICRKEKFVPDGSLTVWLLNRNRNAWKLQRYWNKDITLKVKHSCVELSLLTKCGLQTLNRSWNRSQTSGEVQPPSNPKKFRRAQSKVKQMMIFAYDHRGIIMTDRVQCGTSVTAAYYRDWMQNLRRKMYKNRPDLLGEGPLILNDNARPQLRKVVTDC